MKPRSDGVLARSLLACILCSLGLCHVASGDQDGPWRLQKKITVDDEAWGWNWASWDQEKIATFGHYQYTVYWDADKVLVLVRRDLRDNGCQVLRLPAFRLTNNDAHRNTCLGVSAADGRLHLSWDHHNDPLRYTKSRAGFLTRPPNRMDVADIEPAQPMLAEAKMETRVTYPRFLMDRQGNLFCFYRVGGSGNGNNYLQRYDANEAKWTRLGMVFSSRGTYTPWKSSKSRCAYLHDILFDRRNRLHATWVYREVAASWASNHDLHYAYSDDRGLTWHNNAGKKIADLSAGDPIELNDRGLVVHKIPVYSWLMNAACMALDSRNRPHVVTFKSPVLHQPEKLKHNPPGGIRKGLCFYHFWRDDDGTWRGGDPIDPRGSLTKRPDVVFDEQDTLYFFYPTKQGFRCMVSQVRDKWGTWSSHQMTGPDLTSNDATKHDRVRWRDEGMLSFTAQTQPTGFAILDFAMKRRP